MSERDSLKEMKLRGDVALGEFEGKKCGGAQAKYLRTGLLARCLHCMSPRVTRQQ